MQFYDIQFEASYGQLHQLPLSDLPEIAFCGRSNVGKSSMLNRLFNRKALARVSAKPGKTVTVNFFRLEGLRFADLPGYGYARVAKTEKQRWAGLMEGYFSSGRNLRMVFLLLDMRHPPSRDDLTMLDFLCRSGIAFSIVLTKADKLSKAQGEKRLEELRREVPGGENLMMTPFSAKTGQGIEELHRLIGECVAEQNE